MPEIIRDRYIYAVFGIIFLIEVIVLRPFGNFPLHDDWVHSLSIYEYVRSGIIFYPALLAAFSVVPIVYGIGVSMVFGFSFVALRMTTVILAWGSACFVYAFLRKNDFSPNVSVAATALMLASPLFVNLSYTFMSEIPALFFLTGALFFFSKGFKEKRYGAIALGAFFGLLGFFVRQTDVFIILAAAGAFFLNRDMDRRVGVVIFGACAALLVGGILVFGSIGVNASTLSFFFLSSDILLRLARTTAYILFFLVLTGGTLAPAVMGICLAQKRNFCFQPPPAFILYTCMLVVFGGAGHLLFNQFANIITPFGIGPAPFVMIGKMTYWGPTALYIGAISISIASVAWLLRAMKRRQGTYISLQPWNRFLWYYGVLYSMFIVVAFPWFDRYYILLLPLVCYLAAHALKEYSWSRGVFYGLLGGVFFYSLVGTYNYLAWNEARWRLGDRLVSRGIAREDISGGQEWNGWFFYRDELEPTLRTWNRGLNAVGAISNFLLFHESSPYLLSFSPIEGTRAIDTEPVHGLFSNIKRIYALKKVNPE
jgi:hypothetical protein